MTSWSSTIFSTTCARVLSSRCWTAAPTPHSLGRCEYRAPNTGRNFHAHGVQWASIFTPLLASGLSGSWLLLRPGSLQRVWSTGTNEMSPFAKTASVYCVCSGIHNARIISHMLSTEAVVKVSSIPPPCVSPAAGKGATSNNMTKLDLLGRNRNIDNHLFHHRC